MGLRNRIVALYAVAHYCALSPRCVTHAHSPVYMDGSRQSVVPRDPTTDPVGAFTERFIRKIQKLQATRIFYTEVLTTGGRTSDLRNSEVGVTSLSLPKFRHHSTEPTKATSFEEQNSCTLRYQGLPTSAHENFTRKFLKRRSRRRLHMLIT